VSTVHGLSCVSLCHVLSCLPPPILLSDYCLICPTCLVCYSSLFVPYSVSLCLQSCAGLLLCFLLRPDYLFACFGFICTWIYFLFLLNLQTLQLSPRSPFPQPFRDRTNQPLGLSGGRICSNRRPLLCHALNTYLQYLDSENWPLFVNEGLM